MAVLVVAAVAAAHDLGSGSAGLHFHTPPDPAVKELHVVFSNHFDAGFNIRSWNALAPETPCSKDNAHLAVCSPFCYRVINEYFNEYFPRAVATAAAMRQSGSDAYIWMTQAWLLDLFFDCPNAGILDWRAGSDAAPLLQCPNSTTLATVKAAVQRGDIVFHAFPHNAELSQLDRSLMDSALRRVQDLAKSLGVPAPTSLSQRDVPGAPRAALPLLVARGVGHVSIGSGGPAGGHPVLPSNIFVWRDQATNASVLFTHDDGYGGGTHLLPNGTAMYTAWGRDNTGPFFVADVQQIYAMLRKQYPNARVFASTFDRFLAAAEPQLHQLPVLTSDIGSTWVHGVGSAPQKHRLYREVFRRRADCIARGACDPTEASFVRFDRLLLKVSEHTSGADISVYYNDYQAWSNEALHQQQAENPPNLQLVSATWAEQASYVGNAVRLLGGPHAAFRAELEQVLAELSSPQPPSTAGYTQVENTGQTFECGGVQLAFSDTMALERFDVGQARWADSSHRLGEFVYRSIAAPEFEEFLVEYGLPNCPMTDVTMICEAFGKPNMTAANPKARRLSPTLRQLWQRSSARADSSSSCDFVLFGDMDAEAVANAGAPAQVAVRLVVEAAAGGAAQISLNMTLLNKTATRLPESLWLAFNPRIADGSKVRWQVLGSPSDPVDVVEKGARHLRGCEGVSYSGPDGAWEAQHLDGGTASVGVASAFPTPGNYTPDAAANGVFFNLFNNLWGVNFPIFLGSPIETFRFSARFNGNAGFQQEDLM